MSCLSHMVQHSTAHTLQHTLLKHSCTCWTSLCCALEQLTYAGPYLHALLLFVCPSCSAYADPGALNRAEWIKFVAVFFNKEVEANRIFTKINSDYQAPNTSARATAAATTPPAANRVAWISKFGDTLTMSYAVYKQQLVTVSNSTPSWSAVGSALLLAAHSCIFLWGAEECNTPVSSCWWRSSATLLYPVVSAALLWATIAGVDICCW